MAESADNQAAADETGSRQDVARGRPHVREFREQGFVVLEGAMEAGAVAGWRALFQTLRVRHSDCWSFGDLVEIVPELAVPAVTCPRLLDRSEERRVGKECRL